MVTTPDATVWGPPLMYHVGDPVTATNVQRVSCAACAPTQHLQKTAFGRLRARYVLCTIPVNCMTVFRVDRGAGGPSPQGALLRPWAALCHPCRVKRANPIAAESCTVI